MTIAERDASETVPSSEARARTRRLRLMAVGTAVGAAGLAWILIEAAGEVDLQAPAFEGSGGASDIGLGTVILTSGVASIAGWGLLAALERWTRRPRRIWTGCAVVATLVSLAGPLSGSGISAGNRGLLVLLHVVVAAALIPFMLRSTSDDRRVT